MNLDYKQKYLKYKAKYLKLQNLYGGNPREAILIINGFIEKKDELYSDKKYTDANLNQDQFNNMIKLKRIFHFDNTYSYLAASKFKKDTVGDNNSVKSTGKFEIMIDLKNKCFSDEYAYNGTDLTDDKIKTMIELKTNGFTEEFAYKYAKNGIMNKKDDKGRPRQITLDPLPAEKYRQMIELKKIDFTKTDFIKSDLDIYLEVNPPSKAKVVKTP